MEIGGMDWNERVAMVEEVVEANCCNTYKVYDTEVDLKNAEADYRRCPTSTNRRHLEEAKAEHEAALKDEAKLERRLRIIGLPLVQERFGPPGTLTILEYTYNDGDSGSNTIVTLTDCRWLVDGEIVEDLRTMLQLMDIG